MSHIFCPFKNSRAGSSPTLDQSPVSGYGTFYLKSPQYKAPGLMKAARIGQRIFSKFANEGGRDTGKITIYFLRAYEYADDHIGLAEICTGFSDSPPPRTPFRPIKCRKKTHMDCRRATSMMTVVVMAEASAQADPRFSGGCGNRILQNGQLRSATCRA
jgi:hypothetical protein